MLLGSKSGRASLAALGLLLGATTTGLLPVGMFFAPPPPPPAPKPSQPPVPLVTTTSGPSRGQIKAGHVSLDATLGQGKLLRNEDGTVFLDLRLTADEVKTEEKSHRPVDLALVLDVSGSMADDNKIGLMRQACLGLAEQLGSDDRVSVVSFSDDARVLFPLTCLRTSATICPGASTGFGSQREVYDRAIRELVPSGSTNLSSGLEAGAAELKRAARPEASRRLLLLTDGIANRGTSTPEGLRTLVSGLASQGFSVTTVGLGLDYNASLLSSLSDVGGGNYHYVDAAQKIQAVYASELHGLRSLVAKGLRLQLTPGAGVRIEQVVAWANDSSNDGKRFVTVGDLEAGRSTKVVVQLRVPTDRAVTAEDVVTVALKGEDALSNEALAPTPLALGIGITESRTEADASVATDVQKDLVNARIASELEQARRASEECRYDDAKRSFERLRKMKVDGVSYRGADGKVERRSMDELESALGSGASSAARCAADKDIVSGIVPVGK